MTDTIQTVHLADNINAAFDKINENFEGLTDGTIVIPPPTDMSIGDLQDVTLTSLANGEVLKWDGSSWTNQPDGGGSTNISNDSDLNQYITNFLDSAFFITVINQEYLEQFNITTDVTYTDSDVQANASAIFTLESRIDATDSGITVLSQAITNVEASLANIALSGIDSDVLADAIATANTTIISRIDANSDGISVMSGVIDSVAADLLLTNSDLGEYITLSTNARNELSSRITANESGLTAVVADVTQLGLDLNQFITDGIEITPEQVTAAIGGALDSLTLRLDADSDKLVLEAAKIVDLNTQLTALDSDTGAEIQAEADARNALSATVALIDGRVTSQASDISTLTASVDSDFARIDNELTTIVDDLGNASAVYALNLDVNNHIAGIRLDNDGNTANFAVTADTFKIINASDNEIQPFTVEGDQVELSNATVTGQLDVTTSDATGSMNITGNLITISDAAGTPRVKLGKIV